jgi:hypothetical protein
MTPTSRLRTKPWQMMSRLFRLLHNFILLVAWIMLAAYLCGTDEWYLVVHSSGQHEAA